MSIFATVQDAIVDLLAPLDADQQDGYLQRRAAFNGRSVEKIIASLGLAPPAVVISFSSARIGGGTFIKREDVALRFSLWCADSSLRGQEAAAQGSSVSGEGPGAFQVAQDVIETLRRQRILVAGRDSLGIVFSDAEWIPAKGGLAVVRLDAEVMIPQIDWSAA